MVLHKVRPAIALRTLPPVDYIGTSLRAAPQAVGPEVARAFQRLYAYARRHGIEVEGHPFLVAGDQEGGEMAVEVGVPVAKAVAAEDGVHAGRLPGGRAAVALYQGPYERMEPCFEELQEWIRGQGLEPAGAPREVYLNGPADVTCPEQLLTQLVWPVR